MGKENLATVSGRIRNISVSSGRMLFPRRMVVSNDTAVNVYERIFKLLASIFKMVLDGVRDPHKFADALQAVVDTGKIYLSRLFPMERMMVPAMDGTETLASSGVFIGGVYGLTIPASGKPTPEVEATVNEMIEDGTYTEIFGSLGQDRKRWQQGQVAEFCRVNPDKLRKDGFGTFFEIEGGFVVDVNFGDEGRLEAFVYPLEDGSVWGAGDRRRFVLPQLGA